MVILGIFFADLYMVVCLFVGVVRWLRGRRRGTRKEKLIRIAEVIVPLVFMALYMVPRRTPIESLFWPGATPFTYGFRDRVKSKADIPAIRDWLKTLDKVDPSVLPHDVPPSECPESLRALTHRRVYLVADKDGNPIAVNIFEGGGFFHWGATIGMENMEIPVSKLKDEYEVWLLAELGVYVYEW
jgi:hypothetical protein